MFSFAQTTEATHTELEVKHVAGAGFRHVEKQVENSSNEDKTSVSTIFRIGGNYQINMKKQIYI